MHVEPTPDRPGSRPGLFPAEVLEAIRGAKAELAARETAWPFRLEENPQSDVSVYDGHPYLFAAAFPALSPREIAPLALAARLFATSLFVADDIIDEPLRGARLAREVLRLQALQLEGYRILRRLFPPPAVFWQRFQGYLGAYTRACLDEQRLHGLEGSGWMHAEEAAILRLARGKSGLARFTVTGLAELAADDAPLEALTRSIDRYYLARQMLDDLDDWKTDLERRLPSLLLARALRGLDEDERGAALRGETGRLSREIYRGGHGRDVVELALRSLADARRLSAGFPGLLWRRVLDKLEGHCHEVLGGLPRRLRS